MKYQITIEADAHDKDYVAKLSDVKENQISLFERVADAIREFKPYVGTKPDYWIHKHEHNWPTGEIIQEEFGEKTPKERYVPFGNNGIHTIT